MHLRQVARIFLRKFRLPSHIIVSSSSCCPNELPTQINYFHRHGSGNSSWRMNPHVWNVVAGQAAIMLGINSNLILSDASVGSSSENDLNGATVIGLQKVEDGSVVSNMHTSKWRIFTDKGREFFLQGKLNEAEKLFCSAIQEAREGFGERDPHVASACNNLAELYRIKKEFDKAEPLYLEAINLLEESFGQEDIRVGAALHNLGQFYHMQRKLEESRRCYERALKIKGRVLGYLHRDYAETMYRLGTVLYLQGKENDAEVLIQDSINILEMYLKSNHPTEAERVDRKILHLLELSKDFHKGQRIGIGRLQDDLYVLEEGRLAVEHQASFGNNGWKSLETVAAAERLALTLQATRNIKEASELLERCLDVRKILLPKDHIQIGANMLQLARVAMLISNTLRKINASEAMAELDKARELLCMSARIARQVLNKLRKELSSKKKNGALEEFTREGRTALIILLQSLGTLGLLEISRKEFRESMGYQSSTGGAASAFSECVYAYKEFEADRMVSGIREAKLEYLSCLKHLSNLISELTVREEEQSRRATLEELNNEIVHVEDEIAHHVKRKR
ncbi:hypothetical protein K2173_003781 [Erythroxylum novogranatense]|uniref:Kinesin light chain n=1 Tax=Erythroxylum novogranatense TaxID=1862640 RepID=A0AAV8SIY0_9ROSI|nr:hypothetical protein K2173_003781 [Erythroxylum novogranatense]